MRYLNLVAVGALLSSQSALVFAQAAAVEPRGSGLGPILVSFAIGIASGITVAWMRGWRPGRKIYEEVREHDALDFFRRLGKHIADTPTPGTAEVEVRARTIVSLRDEYVQTLIALQASYNSDISTLSAQLRDLEGLSGAPVQREKVRAAIEQTLEVLRKKWPDKEASINALVRKLRTEAGQKEQ